MSGLPKLTRASVTKSYQGDITGEGKLEYLMMYRDDGSASFLGLERVVGSVGSRSGSFVLQHSGIFKGGVATVTLLVVPDSGTGDLRGLRGKGKFGVGDQTPNVIQHDNLLLLRVILRISNRNSSKHSHHRGQLKPCSHGRRKCRLITSNEDARACY